MRILMVTNMYPTPGAPWLGAFVRAQELSLARLGIEVEVAAHVGRTSRWNYARALPELTGRLRRGRYDLIHSHHTYSTVLAVAARVLARRRVPIVETFHESEIFARGTRLKEGPLRGALRNWLGLKAWALRRADYVIPVQRDMLRVVLGEAGAARVRARVIPAGIDLEQFRPGPAAEARRRLGWDAEGLVVFFPCDPAKPEKRHDLARAGFERFARGRAGARLVVGGRMAYEQMPDALRAADIILHPTDYEASPTAIKEALACERPVVATDTGDIRELYGDLPGVLICDWTAEDVAAKLERAAQVRGDYGGRRRIEALGLSLEQVARRVAEVYEEVLGGTTAERR